MTKNPATTISLFLSWAVVMFAYIYLSHRQISKWDDILIILTMSFAWLVPMSVISFVINFPFDKQFDKFSKIIEPLTDYINSIFTIPIFKFASETSQHIYLMSISTAIHGGLSFIICLYLDKSFKDFLYIFLIISAFKLCENILLTIVMTKNKIE